MRRHLSLLILLLLFAQPLHKEPSTLEENAAVFVTWNVGQGLWTTWVKRDRCFHFDAGGERAPWRAIRDRCLGKQNLFSFSHWDMDHIDFVAKAARRLGRTCILHMPQGAPSARKLLMFNGIAKCVESDEPKGFMKEIDRPPEAAAAGKHSNDLSRVFLIGSEILAPGDSTSHEEKDWAERARGTAIRLLILGHHGSRTSSSDMLLRDLTQVKQAIASCRKARYGHPHAEVLTRLKRKGIAAITTEDWGSIEWEAETPAKASLKKIYGR